MYFPEVEFDCFISLSPFLRSGDRGGVTPRQQNLKSAQFCNLRPVDTLYGTVSSIFTIRLFSIELVFMSSLGGCLVDSRILGECIKCHYLDVTDEGEGEPTKYLGKCKHFSDGRAPDVLAVNCRIREKGWSLARLIEF